MRLVSSFVSSCSDSVVSATDVSSAVNVAHAAGNFGSVTVRVSCAETDVAITMAGISADRQLVIVRIVNCLEGKRSFVAAASLDDRQGRCVLRRVMVLQTKASS